MDDYTICLKSESTTGSFTCEKRDFSSKCLIKNSRSLLKCEHFSLLHIALFWIQRKQTLCFHKDSLLESLCTQFRWPLLASLIKEHLAWKTRCWDQVSENSLRNFFVVSKCKLWNTSKSELLSLVWTSNFVYLFVQNLNLTRSNSGKVWLGLLLVEIFY